MERYYIKNKERISKRSKQYHIKNGVEIRERIRKYNSENRESINEYRRNRYKKYLKVNINCRIRRAINKSIRGNKAGKHWEDLVGYSLDDLAKRLKRTMPRRYTWQDYLDGKLHIDHKIPISAFNYTKPEHADFKRCWALENLRLLPARENFCKGDRLTRPFQPALQI